MPPVSPMLAKPMAKIPPDMHYEGKWDGFRAVIFRDGDEVEVGSRNEKPLTRYFPEVVKFALAELPTRCVVDGEIIIATDGALDFDALLNRIHPADSRVTMLSESTPAQFVAFDVLAIDDEDLTARPFSERRALLEARVGGGDNVHVTPATQDAALAQQWFVDFEGAGLDGVIAKPLSGRYDFGKRSMIKIKHQRTADCVVAGFRWHKSGGVVGSLLLGLYDEAGSLHQVGVSASFTMVRRQELVAQLQPFLLAEGAPHPWISVDLAEQSHGQRKPGGQSRWNAGKDLSWVALRPELVAEVSYDHMSNGRFRHTAKFRNWRPDREAASCTYDQLESPTTMTLADVLSPRI